MQLAHNGKIKTNKIDFLLGYSWIINIIIRTISGTLPEGLVRTTMTFFMHFLLLFLLMLNIRYLKKIKLYDMLFFLFLIFQVLFTFVFYKENSKYLVSFISIWIMIPLYFLSGNMIQHSENSKKAIANASILGVILGWYVYFAVSGQTDKDMSLAYTILPSAIGTFYGFFVYKKKYYLLFGFFGILLLFFLGTRGPLLFSIIFILMMTFNIIRKKTLKFLLFSVCILMFLFVFSDKFYAVLFNFNNWLTQHNIDSYILRNYLAENTKSMDERQVILTTLLNVIKRNPLKGYGICGEYQFVGIYAHNFFVELLIDYGVIVGLFFFLFVIFKLLYVFFKVDIYNKYFLILIICAFFMKLFFSGSYISDLGFYYFMGFVSGLSGMISNKCALKSREEYISI